MAFPEAPQNGSNFISEVPPDLAAAGPQEQPGAQAPERPQIITAEVPPHLAVPGSQEQAGQVPPAFEKELGPNVVNSPPPPPSGEMQ